MAKPEAASWLGDISYRDADGRDVTGRAAVYCKDRAGFDKAVESALTKIGASFLWSEEVHTATGWFSKFGHNEAAAALARAVSPSHLVELAEGSIEEESEDEGYLIIEEIEGVEPLDMQLGVYPKLTVPAVLQEAMFGQPEPSAAEIEEYGENVPPVATYAILDAAKMPYLLTGELSASGLEYQSLFQGDAQEELGERAPYIVRLEEGNDFTRKLFTDLDPPLGFWHKELGIFIRSRADLPTLRKHFRKFTRVQDEQGNWYYFRFWEGDTMGSLYQNSNKRNPKVIAPFGKCTVDSFLYKSHFGFFMVRLSNQFGIIPSVFNIENEIKQMFYEYRKSVQISEMTEKIRNRFKNRLAKETDRNLDTIVGQSVERFQKYNIKKTKNLYLFACWEAFYGLGYEQKDPQGKLIEILNSHFSEEVKVSKFQDRIKGMRAS